MQYPEDHELASRTHARLLVLRASPYPQAVKTLDAIEKEIDLPQGLVMQSANQIREARADAWLKVCALAEEIKKDSNAETIEGLWIRVIDAVQAWKREAE